MGAYQAVPKIFAPFPKRDPEEYIIDHFQLEDFDQISNLFSTPIADAGILGIPIAFMLFGLVHACLWRNWANRKITGLMSWGTKCSYFAVMPYLFPYEQYAGSYFSVSMRYWLIYTIIFSLLYSFYTLISQKDKVTKRII
jgi:hypothetical protein